MLLSWHTWALRYCAQGLNPRASARLGPTPSAHLLSLSDIIHQPTQLSDQRADLYLLSIYGLSEKFHLQISAAKELREAPKGC